MINEITEADAETLSLVHKASFIDGWSAQSFRDMLTNRNFFGFKFVKNNEFNGFILCKIVCEEIEIITFCVGIKFRRNGIGKLLLERLNAYADEKFATIFLEVAEDNYTAIRLYENAGYRKIAQRDGYYKGKNALVMRRIMTEEFR